MKLAMFVSGSGGSTGWTPQKESGLESLEESNLEVVSGLLTADRGGGMTV